MGTSKQDRQGARSVADLERKYNFESFADAYNIATDARNTAEEAKKTAEDAKENPNIDHEAVFNALTEGGKCQGLYRDPATGNIYINAEYIKTGIFKAVTKAVLPPSEAIAEKLAEYLAGNVVIPEAELPLYDVTGNGRVDADDLQWMWKTINGELPTDFIGHYQPKTIVDVTVEINPGNPESAIKIYGTNAWGESVNKTIGVGSAFLKTTENGCLYVKKGKYDQITEWLNPPLEADVEYRTMDRINGKTVFKKYDSASGVVLHKLSNTTKWFNPAGADYVVEQSNSDGYLVRKWASGIAECWFSSSVGFITSKAHGSLYYQDITVGNFPSGLFIFTPIVNVNTVSGSGLVSVHINNVSTVGISAYASDSINTSRTVTFMVHAIGYWK